MVVVPEVPVARVNLMRSPLNLAAPADEHLTGIHPALIVGAESVVCSSVAASLAPATSSILGPPAVIAP